MQDTAESPAEVVIISLQDRYWLANGIDHLDAILAGERTYPTPVMCVAFRDQKHLASYIEGGTDGLWILRIEIVERLRREGELRDVTAD